MTRRVNSRNSDAGRSGVELKGGNDLYSKSQLKGGMAGGCLESRAVGPRCAQYSFGPRSGVVMTGFAKEMQEHFVGAFGLTICSGVISAGFAVKIL